MNYQYWVWALGAAVLVAAGFALGRWRRRGGENPARALDAIAMAALHDVLVPDGMGGQIHVAHLLLTVRGLVVIDVKAHRGVIFASDRMQEWTVIADRRRSAFPNPQPSLYDRVAAVRLLVKEIPVTGHILFGSGADFSKGRPRDVLLVSELEAHYRKPPRAEVNRLMEAFAPHWERIRDVLRSQS